jgi:hypothetical protein
MIRARVIRIISTKQLIFSAGSAAGVKRGMRFQVTSPPELIIDPETGETLGEYPSWKVIIEPDRVFEKFTIASQPYASDFEDEEPYSWPDLPVDQATIQPLHPPSKAIVIGDTVEEIPREPAAADDIPF